MTVRLNLHPFLALLFGTIAMGFLARLEPARLIGPLRLGLTTGTALAVLTIGAGSLTVSYVNDSYFWVVTKFSDMDTTTAQKTHTVATLIMGLTGLVTLQTMVWVLL